MATDTLQMNIFDLTQFKDILFVVEILKLGKLLYHMFFNHFISSNDALYEFRKYTQGIIN